VKEVILTRMMSICMAVSLLLLNLACDREMVEPVRGADTNTTGAGDSSRPKPATRPGALGLAAISPSMTRAGIGFNVQPDGTSALAVTSENATSTTVIFIDDQLLDIAYWKPDALTAIVPDAVFATPGTRKVRLVDGTRTSNVLELTFTP